MGTHTVEFSDQDFDEQVLTSEQPVLVDFWAEWCGPCHAIAPAVEEIASEYSDKVVVGKMNIDDHPQTAMKYGVRSIPSILVFKDGQVAQQVVGAVPKAQLTQMLNKVLTK